MEAIQIDPQIIRNQVARLNYTGRTKVLKTQNGITKFAEIKPTCLQNLLNHVRNHPNDEVGLKALGPQVRAMRQELIDLLPQTTMGWWVVTKRKEFNRKND
jgi:hypothetical protein